MSDGARYLEALEQDAQSEVSHSSATSTFLFALAGGTWAARYAGLQSATSLAEDFSWRAAGLLFCGVLLGVVLAWPVKLLWGWLQRFIYRQVIYNLHDKWLLLMALEPDNADLLPLHPSAAGMPDVADGSRRTARFAERVELLVQRYEKCCKAQKLQAYPRWAIVLMWAAAFLAFDLVLFIWLTVPDAGRPILPLLMVLAGIGNLVFHGIASVKKLAVVQLLAPATVEEQPDMDDDDIEELESPAEATDAEDRPGTDQPADERVSEDQDAADR